MPDEAESVKNGGNHEKKRKGRPLVADMGERSGGILPPVGLIEAGPSFALRVREDTRPGSFA